LPELDPVRTMHDSTCGTCKVKASIPLSRSRLEVRPWRLMWLCEVCGHLGRVLVPRELVPDLLRLERAGGLVVSQREFDDARSMSLDDFNSRAVGFWF
jgi:hypothetical protein